MHITNRLTCSAICLLFVSVAIPFSTEGQTVWTEAPKAANQTLPHGLKLLADHYLTSGVTSDPDHPDKSITENSFTIKVPDMSGHQEHWSAQYGKQLEAMGWTTVAVNQPFRYLDRKTADCDERIVIMNQDATTQPFLESNNVNVRFETEMLSFIYTGCDRLS